MTRSRKGRRPGRGAHPMAESRNVPRPTRSGFLARAVFAGLGLGAVAQLALQPKIIAESASRPPMCSSWRFEPSAGDFIRGVDEALYVSDAPLMTAAERHFCLQKELAPLPIRRIWAPNAGIFLRLQGDVAMLAEISDPVTRQGFFDAIVAGAGPQRRAERADFGSLAVLRLR